MRNQKYQVTEFLLADGKNAVSSHFASCAICAAKGDYVSSLSHGCAPCRDKEPALDLVLNHCLPDMFSRYHKNPLFYPTSAANHVTDHGHGEYKGNNFLFGSSGKLPSCTLQDL